MLKIDWKLPIQASRWSKNAIWTLFTGKSALKAWLGKRVKIICEKGPGPFLQVFFYPFGRFFSSRSYKKSSWGQFLIDILCCLNILNKISKIEKNHTVPLTADKWAYDGFDLSIFVLSKKKRTPEMYGKKWSKLSEINLTKNLESSFSVKQKGKLSHLKTVGQFWWRMEE